MHQTLKPIASLQDLIADSIMSQRLHSQQKVASISSLLGHTAAYILLQLGIVELVDYRFEI